MRAKTGCKLIAALASIVVTAACSIAGSGATTAGPSVTEARLEATVVVTAAPETAATIPSDTTSASSADIYALLQANQCLACHTIGDQGSGVAGPSLNGLVDRIDIYGLAQSAEAYVHESLVNPAAYLPASCPTGQCVNVMPSYADRLSDDELNMIVAFVLSLPSESP